MPHFSQWYGCQNQIYCSRFNVLMQMPKYNSVGASKNRILFKLVITKILLIKSFLLFQHFKISLNKFTSVMGNCWHRKSPHNKIYFELFMCTLTSLKKREKTQLWNFCRIDKIRTETENFHIRIPKVINLFLFMILLVFQLSWSPLLSNIKVFLVHSITSFYSLFFFFCLFFESAKSIPFSLSWFCSSIYSSLYSREACLRRSLM